MYLGNLIQTLTLLVFYGLVGYFWVLYFDPNRKALKAATKSLIWVLVPASIFTSVVGSLDKSGGGDIIRLFGHWLGYFIFVSGAMLIVFGGYTFATRRGWQEQRPLLAMGLITNSIYLPIPIALSLTPPDQHNEVVLHVSLYVVLIMGCTWTLGVWALGRKTASRRVVLVRLLNPPFFSLCAAALFVSIDRLGNSIPHETAWWRIVGMAKYLVGPLGTILFGGFLASSQGIWRNYLSDIIYLASLRGFIIPGVTILAVSIIQPSPVFALVAVVQSCMPPAVNLSVVAAYYEGPIDRVVSTLLPIYLLAIVTLLFWLSIFEYIY
jgi:predicted permease